MKLIIIRGPSGSGKSTIARHLAGIKNWNGSPTAIADGWVEADMYFMHYRDQVNPLKGYEYRFNPRLLGEAHKFCQRVVRDALKHGENIIVSNTSTTLAEVNTYIALAKEFGADYEVIRAAGPWNIDDLFARNEHNVPREVLEKQVARYVAVPGETEWSDMTIFNKGTK